MSGCSGGGRVSDATPKGTDPNDNHITLVELLNTLIGEARLIRAQLECITEEKITLEDLHHDN